MKNTARLLVALLVLLGLPQLASAQAAGAGPSNKPAVGVAVNAGSLGIGLEAAVRVHPKVNIRGAFNFLSLSHNFETPTTTSRTSAICTYDPRRRS